MTSDDAARRSAARERRRAAASDENGRDETGKDSSGSGLESAARAAAAAAAVGAALGAVKALAQRDGHDDDSRQGSNRDERAQTTVADEPSDDGDDADDNRDTATALADEDDRTDAPHEEPRDEQRAERADTSNDDRERRPREGAPAGTVRSIAARAREQLRELQGRDAESITALERTRDGWRVTCEVLEVERIPNSTDVLATYVIELDGDGDLVAFERVRRYYRAQAGGDQ